MYNGRKMIKEYGDYRYQFMWFDDGDIVVYKRTKIKGKNRS